MTNVQTNLLTLSFGNVYLTGQVWKLDNQQQKTNIKLHPWNQTLGLLQDNNLLMHILF